VKIAHLNQTYGQAGLSGTEQSVPNTCTLLEQRGLSTTVLFDQATGPLPDAPGRTVHQVPGLGAGPARLQRQASAAAVEILAAERPDVVHVHQTDNAALLRAVAARWPVFYFVHNHVLTCPGGLRAYTDDWSECHFRGPAPMCAPNAYLRGCNSRRPARVAATIAGCLRLRAAAGGLRLGVDSEFMRRTLVASGFPASRVLVTATVTESPPAPDLRAAPGRQVAFVGRLTPEKGLPALLRAVGRLGPNTSLKIAGDGPLASAARDLAARLGIAGRVEFLGRLDRAGLRALLAESRVLAVPSLYQEPFGLVGPEAMAAARPVVAFPVGGIPEWLEDGVTGLFARPNDVADLAEKLALILADPVLAERLGRAGRQAWEDRFHPDRHVAALLAVYRELAA